MRSILSNNHKSKRKSTQTQQILQTVEKTVKKRTSPIFEEDYLKDEIWDILPKTGYTYARSGSYSPRFFGRKVVWPNMSRYRLRRSGRGAAGTSGQDDVDMDYYEYEEYSDSEDSLTTESVLEEGIELRSGKNLYHLREIELENQRRQAESGSAVDLNYSAKSKSERKSKRFIQNQKQTSRSEVKRYSSSDIDIDTNSSYSSVDYSNVRARRNLENNYQVSSYDHDSTDGVNVRSSKRGRNSLSRQDFDDTERSGYKTVKTVTTVTEEFEDYGTNGELEKGAIEAPEKSTNKTGHYQRGKYVRHLHGLDRDEYSDQESADSYDSKYKYRNGSRYGDSVTTTTTVVTTITETLMSASRSVLSPVWNTVCHPVVTHIVQPAWTHIIRPVLSTVSSVVSSVFFLAYWAVAWPVSALASTVEAVSSWLMTTGVGGVARRVGSTAERFGRWVEHIVMQTVLLDVWIFKRRRGRGCCLCLPLLLLLPLLLALYAGRDMWDVSTLGASVWSAPAAVLGLFSRKSSPPPVIVNDNKEYFTHLNQLILQLQADSKGQLSAADVEAIVYRILNKESAALKADVEGSRSQDMQAQLQWKAEQEARLTDMKGRQNELTILIQNLGDTIASQKAYMATQGDAVKADTAAYIAGLKEKLAALHAELRDLETQHEALLLRVNACCHNETYYAAAIKDNVNAILAQMMAGHMSGNPSQDAFTDWLHSNYVSRETLDKRLQELADDLTAKVVAMVTEVQKSQADAQLADKEQRETVHVQGAIYGVGEQQVRLMIEEALFKYSADKTGLPDFALESAGGTVVSTRCSETFDQKTALVKIFGLPLWYVSNSPRTVLQPDVHPGQCWAFKGPTGYIVIQTSTTITPTGFTLEHIPKSLSPTGKIESAPKDFMVLGLKEEYDDNGQWLGNFTYNDNGNPIQFFPAVLQGERTLFNLFELRILNNYGNPQYTCLYRFRIHGKPYRL